MPPAFRHAVPSAWNALPPLSGMLPQTPRDSLNLLHVPASPALQPLSPNWRGPFSPSREGNGAPLQYSCLENPMDGGAWWAAVHGVAKSRTQLSDFTFTFHYHALEKEMATHSSVLAWRIPGMGEPGGLPSMGSHRVGHDWSNLAAEAAAVLPISLWALYTKDTELSSSPAAFSKSLLNE